jgi:GDPmannose 4,6-dehydratase
LIGSADKAKEQLGWVHKTNIEDLCALMVKEDLNRNLIGKVTNA